MAALVKIPITGISTSQRKIDKQPNEIARVLRGLRAATLFIQSEREIGIGLMEKTLKLDRSAAERFYALYREQYNLELSVPNSVIEEWIAVGTFRSKDKEKGGAQGNGFMTGRLRKKPSGSSLNKIVPGSRVQKFKSELATKLSRQDGITKQTSGKKIYEWGRHPRIPAPSPPPGSCDCQFHIYAEPGKFPPRANPPYPPIESATFAEAQKMHQAIGFNRGVIVHSALYGSDHRLLLNALEGLDDHRRYRGIGILDDSVSDNERARLHAAGVRGARFNFVRFVTLDQREAEVRRSMARIKELGWHARLHVHGDDLLNNSDLLRSMKDLPMVIDHFGHVGFEGGLERPVIRWVLDMLKHENWWMMVSNGNRDSKMDAVWETRFPTASRLSRRRLIALSGVPTGRIRSGASG